MRRDPVDPVPPPWGTAADELPPRHPADFRPALRGLPQRPEAGRGLDFSGGLTSGPRRPHPQRGLRHDLQPRSLIARSNVNDDARITHALAFGSHRSKLVEVLRKRRVQQRAKLSAARSGCGWSPGSTLNGPYHDRFINKRQERPALRPAGRSPIGIGDRRRTCAAVPGVPQAGRRDAAQLDRPAAARAQPVSHRAFGQGGRRQREVFPGGLSGHRATPTIRPCARWSARPSKRHGSFPAATWSPWLVNRCAGGGGIRCAMQQEFRGWLSPCSAC